MSVIFTNSVSKRWMICGNFLIGKILRYSQVIEYIHFFRIIIILEFIACERV